MRNKLLTGLCALALMLLSMAADARPVSYPGGWTFMTMNDADQNITHMLYTLTPRLALGYSGEYWREGHFQLHSLQANTLLKRWNQKNSQGNLYLKSGIGGAYSDKAPFDHDWRAAAFTGLAADWEDRRYYVSYENRIVWADDIYDGFMQKARVGIAPYIGDYGDLHTWLMLQIDHKPESEDSFTVTPMVRFFKGDHLLEAGVSNKGKALFNWTIRF